MRDRHTPALSAPNGDAQIGRGGSGGSGGPGSGVGEGGDGSGIGGPGGPGDGPGFGGAGVEDSSGMVYGRGRLSRRELGPGIRLLPVRAVEAAGARGAVDLEPDARAVVSLDAPPVGEAVDDVKPVSAIAAEAGLTRPLLRVEAGPGVCDLDPNALGRGRGMELDLLGLRVQHRVRHQLADQQIDVGTKVTERAVEASERGARSCRGGGPTGKANGEGLVQKPMRN